MLAGDLNQAADGACGAAAGRESALPLPVLLRGRRRVWRRGRAGRWRGHGVGDAGDAVVRSRVTRSGPGRVGPGRALPSGNVGGPARTGGARTRGVFAPLTRSWSVRALARPPAACDSDSLGASPRGGKRQMLVSDRDRARPSLRERAGPHQALRFLPLLLAGAPWLRSLGCGLARHGFAGALARMSRGAARVLGVSPACGPPLRLELALADNTNGTAADP